MSSGYPALFCAAAAVLAALAGPSVADAQFRRIAAPPLVVSPVVGPTFLPVPASYFSAGSYLHGAASVIDAESRYLMGVQGAKLLREQVRAARLDNRQRLFELERYERANTPTLEEQREWRRQQALRRSWNDPPPTEVWSGKALNNLLSAVQEARSKQGYRGAAVPLAGELVQRINVGPGTVGGSLGAFRQPDDLRWPLPLRREAFYLERSIIDQLAPLAVNAVASGKADAKSLDSLRLAVDDLRSRLRENVRDMSSADYVQALRFVNQLSDSVGALQSPGAAKFMGAWVLSARDVGELLDQMTEKGLRFAPATLGDEAHYTALHRALVTYASALPLRHLRELRAQFYAADGPGAGK